MNEDGTPHVVRTELTGAGRELLAIGESLQRWWGLGTPADWLEAVIECRPSVLRIGGADPLTPRHVVRETHRLLFG